MFAAPAGAAASYGTRSIYSMVHDELEKEEYVIAARLDGASTLNISLVCCDAKHHRRAGHRNHPRTVDGNSRYRRAGLSISARNSPRLNGERCSVMRWNWIYVAPVDCHAASAAIMISVLLVNLLGDGVRRAIIAGWNNAITRYS